MLAKPENITTLLQTPSWGIAKNLLLLEVHSGILRPILPSKLFGNAGLYDKLAAVRWAERIKVKLLQNVSPIKLWRPKVHLRKELSLNIIDIVIKHNP